MELFELVQNGVEYVRNMPPSVIAREALGIGGLLGLLYAFYRKKRSNLHLVQTGACGGLTFYSYLTTSAMNVVINGLFFFVHLHQGLKFRKFEKEGYVTGFLPKSDLGKMNEDELVEYRDLLESTLDVYNQNSESHKRLTETVKISTPNDWKPKIDELQTYLNDVLEPVLAQYGVMSMNNGG